MLSGMPESEIPPIPDDMSYVEWQIKRGAWQGLAEQLPQAMISYSWSMPWELMIEFLESNIGADGVVWIDLLACNQHLIEAGDMQEIQQLPSVIEFVGQTYVMPGTLARLWCIFEMAYSLLFNSRLIYYSNPSRTAEGYSEVLKLLRSDNEQLQRTAKDLLASANCFKASDQAFIYSVIDRNFESREDMVNTIKAFIRSKTDRQLTRLSSVSLNASSPRAAAAVEIEMQEAPFAQAGHGHTPYQLMNN